MIKLEDVEKHKKVFVVTFYDGYTDGHKYSIEKLDTTYMSFYAIYGANYYNTAEEANYACIKLNSH